MIFRPWFAFCNYYNNINIFECPWGVITLNGLPLSYLAVPSPIPLCSGKKLYEELNTWLSSNMYCAYIVGVDDVNAKIKILATMCDIAYYMEFSIKFFSNEKCYYVLRYGPKTFPNACTEYTSDGNICCRIKLYGSPYTYILAIHNTDFNSFIGRNNATIVKNKSNSLSHLIPIPYPLFSITLKLGNNRNCQAIVYEYNSRRELVALECPGHNIRCKLI